MHLFFHLIMNLAVFIYDVQALNNAIDVVTKRKITFVTKTKDATGLVRNSYQDYAKLVSLYARAVRCVLSFVVLHFVLARLSSLSFVPSLILPFECWFFPVFVLVCWFVWRLFVCLFFCFNPGQN